MFTAWSVSGAIKISPDSRNRVLFTKVRTTVFVRKFCGKREGNEEKIENGEYGIGLRERGMELHDLEVAVKILNEYYGC